MKPLTSALILASSLVLASCGSKAGPTDASAAKLLPGATTPGSVAPSSAKTATTPKTASYAGAIHADHIVLASGQTLADVARKGGGTSLNLADGDKASSGSASEEPTILASNVILDSGGNTLKSTTLQTALDNEIAAAPLKVVGGHSFRMNNFTEKMKAGQDPADTTNAPQVTFSPDGKSFTLESGCLFRQMGGTCANVVGDPNDFHRPSQSFVGPVIVKMVGSKTMIMSYDVLIHYPGGQSPDQTNHMLLVTQVLEATADHLTILSLDSSVGNEISVFSIQPNAQ